MYEYRAKVVRVIDGDTIIVDIDLGFNTWLKNQSIRLEGINTPEVRTKDELEKKVGLFVKDEVERLIGKSCDVILETILDKSEKFGRILGIFHTTDGINLNEYLVEQRYAVAYFGQSKEQIAEEQNSNINWLIENKNIL